MALKGVIRTDNVKATRTGGIRSAKFYNGSNAQAIIENGNLVVVDVLLDASATREVFKATIPSAVTNLNVGIVASPELIYDESTHKSLAEYENVAGQVITVLMLAKGDILSISDECIVPINDALDLPEVGSYVVVTASSTKWTELASLGGTELTYGKIIARELYKKDTYLNVV